MLRMCQLLLLFRHGRGGQKYRQTCNGTAEPGGWLLRCRLVTGPMWPSYAPGMGAGPAPGMGGAPAGSAGATAGAPGGFTADMIAGITMPLSRSIA